MNYRNFFFFNLTSTGLIRDGGKGGTGNESLVQPTPRASLSGTFLQTLPDLVTLLKGTLYLHGAVHRRGQRLPKGLGTEETMEAT